MVSDKEIERQLLMLFNHHDTGKITRELGTAIKEDVAEVCGNEYTSEDVRIAVCRVLMNKLFGEEEG